MASDALVPYRSSILASTDQSVQRSVQAAIAALADDVLAGRRSPREIERIRHTLDPLAQTASAAARIVHDEIRMSTEAAEFSRTVESIAAEIASLRRLRMEQDLICEHLPSLIAAEMQALRHRAITDAADAELRRVHAEQAVVAARQPTHALPVLPEGRPPEPQLRTWAEELRETRLRDREQDRARLAEEVARIVTRVRNAGPLFDRQHRYDGYTACVYVQGKLDGLTSDKATERAAEALLRELSDGATFTPAEVQAYERRYKALHRELRHAADARTSATLLASANRFMRGVR